MFLYEKLTGDQVMFPTVRLDEPVKDPRNTMDSLSVVTRQMSGKNIANMPPTITPAATPPASTTNLSSFFQEVEFNIYDQNFDDLNDNEKQRTICMLLDTLPSVKDMKEFLLTRGGQDTPLHTCDRITPAALGILRWIIASNRSCIVQVDSIEGAKSEERVSGMPGWIQFRFAQGAPDKEQRFISSIRKTTETSKHPTMFAWHGSPLHNWHGIVREGLHFEKTDHGRAYGHGVYHSSHVQTSLGYSGMGGRIIQSQDSTAPPGQWPHSQLRISQALALNEIVNAPDQFVSKDPHLVVAQLDWIQSRYMFVMCNIPNSKSLDTAPTQVLEQDPLYIPTGMDGKKLAIPLNAISKSRRPHLPSSTTSSVSLKSGNKKQKVGAQQVPGVTPEDDPVILSDDTDVEDSMIFFPTKEEEEEKEENEAISQVKVSSGKGKGRGKEPAKKSIQDASKTDFIPGTHNHKTLPLIEPPHYATSSASRTLQRELTATLKIQDTHPIHELGWYIDRELITNIYQWIVELHSFEPHLPLAEDMKKRGLKSIVTEIRFGKDYPMSPPFVRIIRPRFLGFQQGGGGHVTAGGALCMELLTNSGWSAVSNIESVLLQVRLAMSSMDPKPARLEDGHVKDYGVGEAVDAYIRACNMHGVSSLRNALEAY